ncbi:hypothetical protein [Clostridium tagluense]|uniref:Uncharacterized protein n=1 Tax=Clostridium tagluense TaxID=360422 RepID=A0A401UQ51_9CLOT|nr:hypothetical protein [Clostridium tagluense]GCD11659.1 hypothetical protein Ctaglu_32820 [Clostridium tagluense]
MDIKKHLNEIVNKEVYSRVNSHVAIGELDSSEIEYIKKCKNFEYVDFEDRASDFFRETKMTIKIFDTGDFFKYIKQLSSKSDKILVIDNLQIIQNILYSLDGEGNHLKQFFVSMINQSFTKEVLFIFSNIRIMKMEKCLKKADFPQKNTIKWGD